MLALEAVRRADENTVDTFRYLFWARFSDTTVEETIDLIIPI